MPKEETFPTPLKYTDVIRSTHTDLDVMQGKRIDGFWNVDSNRSLSDSRKEFAKFTLPKEKPPTGYIWSGERLAKVQTTTRSDYVWREVWTKIGNAAQNREKQEMQNEKPKLGNARRLRGIYYVDPDDHEYTDTLKTERRKLERPADAVMPCKKEIHTSNRKLAAEVTASHEVPKPSTVEEWNHTNPQGNEWNHLYKKK